MGTQNWRTALSGVSAVAALAAVVLMAAALLGDAGWSPVVVAAVVAVLCAVPALLADPVADRRARRRPEGRHQ
ncbi:hypothetical protein [Actinacidiphila sp. ITFR-21]|uniref:hypothetical protein n=1 Tax=Actinacidiphila sp. ITFR-21 TaxID=3075199 RepID=UPI00288A877B|nr:hypothetical protein [Streptomyces sp. ITFR-21]WNI19100.1 hypothetical protein RLT57_28590 [Streptomyces sp. ITFR-21]